MGYLLLAAFVAVLASTVSAADLYVNRITGSDTSRGRQYTVTYTSSVRPIVVTGQAIPFAYYENDPDVDITSTYANGQGETTIIKPEKTSGIMFAMFANEQFIYYFMEDFVGDKEMPELELESLDGDVLDYTQDVPLPYRMKFSNPPGEFSPGQLFYYFKHVSSRDNPVLKTAPSFGSSTTNQKTDITGNYTVISAEANMASKEGVSLVILYHHGDDPNMAIFKVIAVAVKQEEHQAPFPDGFIGLAVLNSDRESPICRDSSCLFKCDAFGSDIVDVQVRRKEDGEVMEPLFRMKMNEWYVTTGYQRPAEDFGQTFVCSATNAQGKTTEKDIVMQSGETKKRSLNPRGVFEFLY